MRISSEFSKYALKYGTFNIIQKKVVKKLLQKVTDKPKNILDLGCGSGTVCKSIDWEYESFTGVDFASGMLELHPKSSKVDSLYGNFNDQVLFENLLVKKYDYIISASALQWAKDLDMVFKNIKCLSAPIALAIFTSNTFEILNKTAGIDSLLRSSNEVKMLQKKYFDAEFEIVKYKLEFESTKNIFKYIKQSGISGSRKVLDYKQTKKLMNEYPVNYLEFEVAFIYSR